jgi:hypothetical protein
MKWSWILSLQVSSFNIFEKRPEISDLSMIA